MVWGYRWQYGRRGRPTPRLLWVGLVSGLVTGLWVGFAIGFAFWLVSSWSSYVILSFAQLAAKWRTPLRHMRFLNGAHSRAGPATSRRNQLADLRESVKGWFLERKLRRGNGWDPARTLLVSLVIRVVASAACFISMVLIAWAGALLGVIAVGGWRALRVLNEASILAASQQADRFTGDLLPVLVVWALLLLVTPTGYDRAFSAMVALAGVVSYLHLVPPAFLFPSWMSRASRALSQANTWIFHLNHRDPKNPIASELLGAVLVVALLLHTAARERFRRLPDLGMRRAPRPPTGVFTRPLTKKIFATPLIALLLMLVIWAGTVVRLAASHGVTPVRLVTYGAQGGLTDGEYLFIVMLIAILVAQLGSVRIVLLAVLLTLGITLVPIALKHTTGLRVPLWSGQLAAIGRERGTESLWIALFACVPVILYGTHLVGKLLAPRTIKLN